MRLVFAISVVFSLAGILHAEEPPRPVIELLFSNTVRNTGTLGGMGRRMEWADGEGARFGPGLRGMGLDLTASSRSGGSDRSVAGGSVILDAIGIHNRTRMTITLWFKPESLTGPARLLYYGPSWDLYLSNTVVGFKTRHNQQDQPHQTSSDESPIALGEWNFLAVTLDESAGRAVCWHGLKGGELHQAGAWHDIPPLDHKEAALEIGNLSGIRPFKGVIDSVRLFDQVLTADQVKRIHATEAKPRLSLKERAGLTPVAPPLFHRSDVCLSSRSIRPKSIETIQAFQANRLMWAYSTDASFISKCKDAGAETYQAAINSLPGHDNTEAQCLDLNGRPMVAPWMVAFNREKPVYWGCNNRPRFMETCLERAKAALDHGADWLQFDDWALIVSAARWGGACFCDECLTGFREYLRTRLSDEERSAFDIEDLDTFDYRRYLADVHDIHDADTYKNRRRSLPLAKYFEDFQYQSVRAFFAALRRQVNSLAGRNVPLSINSSFMRPDQRSNFLADQVDFLQGETWHFNLTGLTIACKTAEGLGKWQVFVPKPKDVDAMRAGIAATYAMGQLMLVPWDMYMGSDATGIRPRYYGTTDDYGDLYHFIRNRKNLFDGYANPAGVGVVIDLDHYDGHRVTQLCRKLLETQTPFAFLPVGHSHYDSGLDADRLSEYELVILASDASVLASGDQAALRDASGETAVLSDQDVSAELLMAESPFELWGPRGVYLIPRMKPRSDDRTLVCHILNQVNPDESNAARELHWISFLIKRWAFPGNRMTGARWYAPDTEPVSLEFERLASGVRVIIPRLPSWGIVELKFQ